MIAWGSREGAWGNGRICASLGCPSEPVATAEIYRGFDLTLKATMRRCRPAQRSRGSRLVARPMLQGELVRVNLINEQERRQALAPR